jgi:hypothetical protein
MRIPDPGYLCPEQIEKEWAWLGEDALLSTAAARFDRAVERSKISV